MAWKNFRLDIKGPVVWIWLNRPQQANALDLTFWSEFPQLLNWIDEQPELRVAVLAGEGRHFCAGADLGLLDHLEAMRSQPGCAATARESLRREILRLQNTFNALECLRIPVIAAIHGSCIGAGVDLIAACDLRYSTVDAKFCVKEIDLGIVADVGALQRLRHIIGLPALTALSYTADTILGPEAMQLGLVGDIHESTESLYAKVDALAKTIASKSALAVRGIKQNLLYARDHSVADALDYVATWNAAMLQSDDFSEALVAMKRKLSKSKSA